MKNLEILDVMLNCSLLHIYECKNNFEYSILFSLMVVIFSTFDCFFLNHVLFKKYLF